MRKYDNNNNTLFYKMFKGKHLNLQQEILF